MEPVPQKQFDHQTQICYVATLYQFADIHTIDETANYEGRKIVVEKLIEELNRSR